MADEQVPTHRNTTYEVQIEVVHPIEHEVAMIALCVQALGYLDADVAARAVRYLGERFDATPSRQEQEK